MKSILKFSLAITFTLLVGCAGTPQQPVQLAPTALSKDVTVGIVMAPIPKIDTHQMGADCLLCAATAAMGMSKLTDHITKLPAENLPQIKNEIAALLQKKGMTPIVIPEDIDISKLPSSKSKVANTSEKDFSPLKTKYHIDKLIVIEIQMLGTFRTYAAYVPTSDPQGVMRGRGYLVDLTSNTYEWYLPIDVTKASNEAWDEPPNFPGVSNAYFQAIEIGRATLEKPFSE